MKLAMAEKILLVLVNDWYLNLINPYIIFETDIVRSYLEVARVDIFLQVTQLIIMSALIKFV